MTAFNPALMPKNIVLQRLLVEILEALGCWKWWKKPTPLNRAQLLDLLDATLLLTHHSADDAYSADYDESVPVEVTAKSFSDYVQNLLTSIQANESMIDREDFSLTSNFINLIAAIDGNTVPVLEHLMSVSNRIKPIPPIKYYLSPDEFDLLTVRQEAANASVNPDWRNAGYRFDVAFSTEYVEFWEHLQEGDRDAALMEIVDMLHFLMSLYLLSGKRSYDLMAYILALPTSGEYEPLTPLAENTHLLVRAMRAAQVTDMAEVLHLYAVKNSLNIVRQKCGYKDGHYKKHFTLSEIIHVEKDLALQFGLVWRDSDSFVGAGKTVGFKVQYEDNDIILLAQRLYQFKHGAEFKLDELISFLTFYGIRVQQELFV